MLCCPALRRAVACAFLAFLAPLAWPYSRPLPEDVDIAIFAKQKPRSLELLVRVPLDVVRNTQFPTRGDTGGLDLNALQPMLPGVVRYWISPSFDVYEDGQLVKPEVSATRISPPSDQSFRSYREASSHFLGSALPPETDISYDQAWLDVSFEYPLHSEHPVLAILPKLAQLGVRVSTRMTWLASQGSGRNFAFEGDPGLIYPDARWSDAVRQFTVWGFRLVLHSADFLLFLFCLVLPLRQYQTIFPAALAFAGTLCLALAASGAGFTPDALWWAPLIETASALAILLAALANIMGGVTPRRRALFALTAGIVYGYTCSLDLAGKIQFGGTHSLLSRAAFGLGSALAVALGIALLTPSLAFVFRFARTRRVELIVVSALAADTAWGWLSGRWDRLSQIPFHLPTFDASLLAGLLRWLMLAVLFGGLIWFVDGWLKSREEGKAP